jgi:hypothetical protein
MLNADSFHSGTFACVPVSNVAEKFFRCGDNMAARGRHPSEHDRPTVAAARLARTREGDKSVSPQTLRSDAFER